jgi:phosphatidylserine/phosphatidylglycerophosphate/cardiolipin synthase-like enzyme
VGRQDLRLAFAESRASSVDVHVEGRNFYPPMLEDIRAATSSIHINQFGFRPGVIGDAFAEAMTYDMNEDGRWEMWLVDTDQRIAPPPDPAEVARVLDRVLSR